MRNVCSRSGAVHHGPVQVTLCPCVAGHASAQAPELLSNGLPCWQLDPPRALVQLAGLSGEADAQRAGIRVP